MLAATGIALAACGSSGSSGSSGGGGTTTLRYQEQPGQVLPIEIAGAKGYLPGIKLDDVGSVNGGPEEIEAVSSGAADVGAAYQTAVIKAIAEGAPLKAVAAFNGSDSKAFSGLFVLDGSPIHSAKELVGKKVGVNTLGAADEVFTHLYGKKEGLSPAEIKQIELVVVPSLTDEVSLRKGQVEAIYMNGQIRETAEKKGGIRPLVKDYEIVGGYQTLDSYYLSTNFIKENPKAAATVAAGLAKADDWLSTASRAEVIKEAEKIAAEQGRTEENAVLEEWKSEGIGTKGGYFRPEKEWAPWIKYLEEEGEIKPGQVTLNQIYTNQYNPYAPKS